MRRRIAQILCLALLVGGLPVSTATADEPTPPPRKSSEVSDRAPDSQSDAPGRVPVKQRTKVLGKNWRTSTDLAWTTAGDASGLHVLTAKASTGYAWRTVATLSEEGFEADSWIGQGCATAKDKIIVAYAPRTFTNRPELFARGGFTAIVDLKTGKITKLPVTSTLAYHSPGCGTGTKAVVTQDGGPDRSRTRMYRVDTGTGKVSAPITLSGQLTSAVPVAGESVVAAGNGQLLRISSRGRKTAVALTSGVAFDLRVDKTGGVGYLDQQAANASFHLISANQVARPATRPSVPTTLALGRLTEAGTGRSGTGTITLQGGLKPTARLPKDVWVVAGDKNATPSSTAALLVESAVATTAPSPAAGNDPTVLERPVQIKTRVVATDERFSFVAPPSTKRTPARQKGANRLNAASPTQQVEDERYCSVPRNDVRNQAMQPKPRQVEWAVDQAVRGVLNVSRPANWKSLGMPAYTPQGLFPPRALTGGGNVPAQVMLGILAQESNLWQAPGHVVPGVTGNPLTGNFYGYDINNRIEVDDWTVRWDKADCGYGVGQVTDGMRLAGKEKRGETALPYQTPRAVA